MKAIHRTLAVGVLAIATQAAMASIVYNIVDATARYNNGTEPLSVNQTGTALDLTGSSSDISVGAAGFVTSGRGSATVTVVYTATSTQPVTGIDLSFSYGVFSKAVIGYSEQVQSWDGATTLATASGLIKGSGVGGADAFETNSSLLSLSTSETQYKVRQTFTLADLDSSPASSFASIGLISDSPQAVPEPASLAALGIGAFGLILRRRRSA